MTPFGTPNWTPRSDPMSGSYVWYLSLVFLPVGGTYVSYGHSLTGDLYSPTEQETCGLSARYLDWVLGSDPQTEV